MRLPRRLTQAARSEPFSGPSHAYHPVKQDAEVATAQLTVAYCCISAIAVALVLFMTLCGNWW